tara:strand:- start:758 stop:1030 length:273 start_codon:yes stop_codon:yes gene_type:complete
MQIKLNLNGNWACLKDCCYIINVSGDADFLEVFTAITKAMRDECIYEDEIQSITFDAEGRLRLRHLLDALTDADYNANPWVAVGNNGESS